MPIFVGHLGHIPSICKPYGGLDVSQFFICPRRGQSQIVIMPLWGGKADFSGID
jgi:hypothetical protein